jgi:hypothetical protein
MLLGCLLAVWKFWAVCLLLYVREQAFQIYPNIFAAFWIVLLCCAFILFSDNSALFLIIF